MLSIIIFARAQSGAMKTFYTGHTKSGSAMTRLILQTFRLHGALIDSGEILVRPVGLTAARWQVISCVARAAQPAPVAHIAREMGLARQSVQRLADRLAADGLIEYRQNANHKRAPVVVLTDSGKRAFDAATKRQVGWVNSLADGVKSEDIETALAVLIELDRRLRTVGQSGLTGASER